MSLRLLVVAYLAVLVGLSVWQHKLFFSWPSGLVVGNLLASAMWAPLAFVHLDRLARKHHHEHLTELRRLHAEHVAHLKAIAAALKDKT